MTVTATTNEQRFHGGGTVGPFTWNWRFLANADIEVYQILAPDETDPLEVRALLVENTDYTLTGAGLYTGGSLTLVAALAVDTDLLVQRNTRALQPVDLRNQGNNFLPSVHEDAFDNLTMMAQDRDRHLGEHDDAIDSLEVRAEDMESRATAVEARATAVENRATSLESRATAVEGRADVLESDVDSLESRATTVEGRATTLEGRATTLEGRATAVEGRATTVEGRASSLESQVAALGDGALYQTSGYACNYFGGQLKDLLSSLSDPLVQDIGIVFMCDSIGWGVGATGVAVNTPRDHTLSDARNNASSVTFVNEFRRYIGAQLGLGTVEVLSNHPAAPTGESISTFTKDVLVYPAGDKFTVAFTGAASEVTDLDTNALLNSQRQLRVTPTDTLTLSFIFTGTEFDFVFSAIEDGGKYKVYVNGAQQGGTFSTRVGDDGLTAGWQKSRTHTFDRVVDGLVEIVVVHYDDVTSGTTPIYLEAIRVPKTVRVSNQGIIGITAGEAIAKILPASVTGSQTYLSIEDFPFLVDTPTGSTSYLARDSSATVTGRQYLYGFYVGAKWEIDFPVAADKELLSIAYSSIADTGIVEVLVGGIVIDTFDTCSAAPGGSYGYQKIHLTTLEAGTTAVKLRTSFSPYGSATKQYIYLEGLSSYTAADTAYPTDNSYGDGVALSVTDDFVFVQYGTNDRLDSASYAMGGQALAANMETVISLFPTGTKPIVMGPPPAEDDTPPTYFVGMQDQVNALRTMAEEQGIDFINNFSIFEGVPFNVWTSDGLHPNDLGHVTISRNIINALENAVGAEDIAADVEDADITRNLATFNDVISGGPVIDVRKYLPVGAVTDASISYQTEIAAAVAAAYAAGLELYWPHVYLTTSNIPNFHDVRHKGPGGVKRSSFIFYVSPKPSQTNTIYVNTTGSDSNDGIHTSQPLLTVQKASDILRDFAPRLPGRWIVKLAAGTYNENVNFDSMTEGIYPVSIAGPAKNHPDVPTAIINAVTTSGNVLSFAIGGWWQVEDIKLTGATTGYGVNNNNSYVQLNNVHIAGCKNAVRGISLANTTASGGIWVGTGVGVADGCGYAGLFNSIHTLAGTSSADATQVSAFETGVLVDEGAQGHMDYLDVADCAVGVNHKRGAGACNTDHLSLKRNTVGYRTENSGWFNNQIVFGTGADANTTNIETRGSAPEADERCDENSSRTSRAMTSISGVEHTGTAAKTSIWTLHTIRSWWLGGADVDPAHTSDIKAYLQPTLTGNCTLFITLGGTDVTSIVIPPGITNAVLEARLFYTGVAEQRCFIEVRHSTGIIHAYAASAIMVKNTQVVLEVKAQLVNSGDSLTLRVGEYSTTIGG